MKDDRHIGKRNIIRGFLLAGSVLFITLTIWTYLFYYSLNGKTKFLFFLLTVPVFVLGALNLRWGLFCLLPLALLTPPLTGYTGMPQPIPPSLVLLPALLGGWSLRGGLSPPDLPGKSKIVKGAGLTVLFLLIFGLMTALRFACFEMPPEGSRLKIILDSAEEPPSSIFFACGFLTLTYLAGPAVFFITISVERSRSFADRVLHIILGLSIIITVYALGEKYFFPPGSVSSPLAPFYRIKGTFSHADAFGFFLSLWTPVLVGIFLTWSGRKKILALMAFFLSLAVFPDLRTAIGTLALLTAGGIFAALRLSENKYLRGSRLKLTAAVVCLLAAGTVLFLAAFGRREIDRCLQDQIKAVDSMKLNPLIGAGIGGIKGISYPHPQPQNAGPGTAQKAAAGSLILIIGTETGLIGLGLGLWIGLEIMGLTAGLYLRAGASPEQRFLFYGLIAGAAAAFVHFCCRSYFDAPEIHIFFGLLLSVIYIFKQPKQSGESNRPANSACG